MSAPDRHVAVTIKPDGQVIDVSIGGVSIAHALLTRGTSLTLAPGDLPQLYVVLTPDEVHVKGAAS